ncbi:MAG TPA: MFS transporter [Actinomycetota bacterium]|nr:MFS transporter [Actinomycetota bacterium]
MGMIKRGLALIFRRRDFGLLMGVQFLAQAGDGLFQTAVAKAVAFGGQEGFDVESASSVDELITIVLFLFVPYTVISPFLGVVIDRWDRRKLLFVSNVLRAALVGVIALVGVQTTAEEPVTGLLGTEVLPSVLLFLTFMLTLACTRVVLATKAAALPATLDGSSLVEANAVSQLGGALFQLGAAGVAFIASSILPAWPIIVAGAVVYGAAGLMAMVIQRAGEPHPAGRLGEEIARVARSIAAGIREVARTPKAAASISTYFWLRFLWSFTIVGVGFTARELVADKDLQVLILTGGAGAVGAVLGFILAARLHERVKTTARLVLAASAVAGVAVAVLGGLEMKLSIALLTFFLGFGFFLGKISLDTMVQEALGDDFRGRAFSLYDIAYNLAWVLAAVIMKLFYDSDTAGVLVASMGVVFLVGLGLLGAWFKRAGLLTPTSASATQ